MLRASHLGKMTMDLVCISDDSIKSCIRKWDCGNPYQDLNVIAQDMFNIGFQKYIPSFAEDIEPVADSTLRRNQLYEALK